ncbi:glycosyltransferase involved in cell wall biosynthesis [Mycolicibacterium sp. BK556]|uniref:glycosyltransferase n=1 Tax=unclassified Mycolicibacterium TaxID=2636767 RepID=UPI0016128F78|nr:MULTISPECIES: glycosyltransferase [unclassified Mycolicibacterium]MBB3604898.1 glycosyltransferase involved in cell wall biosynthesis [Mycolicibacterium sp. BK556]MBB3635094.1 glycosyltransferase involved in cell wall biosynthesis [Mycolicibacterium sp. BK607]
MSQVLVVDQEPPQACRDGGAARMVALLRLLRNDGHSVTFASRRPRASSQAGPEEQLASLGVTTVRCPIDDWLVTHTPDIVIASRLPVADEVLPIVKTFSPTSRFVYDATHVEYLAKYRLAKLTGNRPLLAAAVQDKSAERKVVAAADAVVAVSEEDAGELRGLDAEANIHIVPAVHAHGDSADLAAGPRTGIVFLGYLGMPENEIAVRRLVDRVWPLIESIAGPTRLTVIGAAAPAWLLAAAADRPRLALTGQLADIDQTLREAAVMVVPLTGGAGVKTKVLHAFARRLPVVATADGLRGIPAVHGVHALYAQSDSDMAGCVAQLLESPTLGTELADRAAELLRARFNDDVNRAALCAALECHG